MKKLLVIALFAAGSMTALADHPPGTPASNLYDANATGNIWVGVYQPTTAMVCYNPSNDQPGERIWFNAQQTKSFEVGFCVEGAAARMFNIQSTITVDPDELSTSYAVVGPFFMTIAPGVQLNRDNTPEAATYAGVINWSPSAGATAGGAYPAAGPAAYQAVTPGNVVIHMGWPAIYPDFPFSPAEYATANDPTKRFIQVKFDATAGLYGTSGKGTIIVRLDVDDAGAII